MSTLGRNQGLVGEKMFTRKSRGTEKKKKIGGWQKKKKRKEPQRISQKCPEEEVQNEQGKGNNRKMAEM